MSTTPELVPWWDPGADRTVSPETDGVAVAGVTVAKGSRVRLRLGWRLPRQRGQEPLDRLPGPLDLDEPPAGVVTDQPGQAQPPGQGVHERPEPDPCTMPSTRTRVPVSPMVPAAYDGCE